MSDIDERHVIADLLFQTNLSYREIGEEIDKHETYVIAVVKELGFEWVRRKGRKMSRGASALTHIFKELIPGVEIINEHHVGERLMLDIYCPKYKIGAEYHGRQHFYYTGHFHKTKEEFNASQLRDERKIELCNDQGISLVVFRYNDDLTEDTVFNRIMDTLRDTEFPEKAIAKKKKPKNAYYEEAQGRRRVYWRQQYKKLKETKKSDINKSI